jgi:L-asparaginase
VNTPALIIHAGAGLRERTAASAGQVDARLRTILAAAWEVLLREGARAAARAAVEALEDEPLFNAGTGSKLQADGVARMSAAIMSGDDGVFSGVINLERLAHPVAAADRLRREPNPVLAGPPARAWLAGEGFADHDPVTAQRRAEWQAACAGAHGTVGAVALDAGGCIAAATSTGGVGMERPGRVSDTATVAGTYAQPCAAVSMTGIGEHIVNHAAAVRIVTRCSDGLGLAEAVSRTLAEAAACDYQFGLIALAADGSMTAGQVGDVQTMYAARRGDTLTSFLDSAALQFSPRPRLA